jgi:uncharacterized membrane protein YdjX (TVP38/TMEM64 family)
MRWAVVFTLLLALILVPFVLFEEQFNAIAQAWIGDRAHRGVAAVGVAMLLASDVLLPIPSSLVSAAAGALLGLWQGAAVVWVGMTASCLIGYAFGATAAARAKRFVGEQGMARAQILSSRYGDVALVLCRPVPVLAEATVIAAGIVQRPVGRFLALTSLANLGVAVGYAAIGAYSMQLDSFLIAFLGSMLVPALGYLISRRWIRSSPPV